jgi:hypothetical protein
MDTTLLIIAVAVALVLGGVLGWYLQNRRSVHLKERFGPEYERASQEAGSIRQAEAALAAREKRVEKLHIRPLTPDETGRFSEVWRHVQTLFVDDPKGAIDEADDLVNQVMSARGYPLADFHQRAADISVDHPIVVEHYRAARAICDRHRQGTASTEDMRQAVIHYRALFEDLLRQPWTEAKQAHEVVRR